MSTPNVLPPYPDLVLRIGFAGNRSLPSETKPLDTALDAILAIIARELRAVLPTPSENNSEKITRFYAPTAPCLRLVTGLAEGADESAALALDRLTASQATVEAHAQKVRPELAAILPFDLVTYAESRNEEHRDTFEARRRQCAYVLSLDGMYSKRTGEPPIDARRRNRAYRAQAATLLRHVDLLVAALDLSAESKPGGTLETVSAALEFDLPVILVDLSAGATILPIEPEDGLNAFLDKLRTAREQSIEAPQPWEEKLQRWVHRIVADPDYPLTGAVPGGVHADTSESTRGREARRRGQQAVEEYLTDTQYPPLRLVNNKPEAHTSLRAWVWTKFERLFRPSLVGSTDDAKLKPFDIYRSRATSLNYYYTGLYRGAFVFNYALAVGAVLLAALSLVLIGLFAARHSHAVTSEVTQEAHTSLYTAQEIALTLLALGKLGLLIWIARNTDKSRHGNWSDRAVDYRYLAERLRTMYYLPLMGSFQPPAATPLNYASRNVRQSGIDWLFEAIVRSVSPAQVAALRSGVAQSSADPALRLDAVSDLLVVQKNWIGCACDPANVESRPGAGQIFYHQRNSETLRRMHEGLDKTVHICNKAVIGVVALDVLALLTWMDQGHAWTPWLIFIAAVLPAVVASLNGLRFQSECQRLADRSSVMADLLADRATEAKNKQAEIEKAREFSDTDLGSYNWEALKLVEDVARDMVEEVAEWSVLYAKDVTDT